jgi:hypothetical protein
VSAKEQSRIRALIRVPFEGTPISGRTMPDNESDHSVMPNEFVKTEVKTNAPISLIGSDILSSLG